MVNLNSYLVFCNRGIEEICSLEIKELIGSKCNIGNGYCIFKTDKDIHKIIYLGQSIKKVIKLIGEYNYSKLLLDFDKIKDNLGDGCFRVNSEVINNKTGEKELNEKIGALIVHKLKQKVNLENPDSIIFAFLFGKKLFLGIDIINLDLSKRTYRIFSQKNIKSTIAYAMVRLSGYKKDIFIDPFCANGMIAIEAALFAISKSHLFYDKDKLPDFNYEKFDKAKKLSGKIYAFSKTIKDIYCAKKNAKIAGVNKIINFSKNDIEWLDTKFKKESIDRIVSCLPNISKFSNRKQLIKIYNEFFYQSNYVLKKKGRVVVCTTNVNEVKDRAINNGLNVSKEIEVWQGEAMLNLLVFKK